MSKMRFKKGVALLLSALMAFSVCSAAVVSAGAVESTAVSSGDTLGDYEYTVLEDGTVEITGYIGSDTEIVIPSEIEGKSVTSIGWYAFYGCTGLTSVTIPDSVTSIGDSAFEDCTGLISITIPDGVTSIGDSAFEDCTGLTSITIPDSVTSISYRAFYGCTGLTSLTIPDSVTSIGERTFYGCTGLTSITIPDSVTSIDSGVFYGCTGLTSVTIPDSVTSIGDSTFEDCTGLTNITIPDSVTSIGSWAFSGCTDLTIYGYKGTAAEQYANDNYFKFVALDYNLQDNKTNISVDIKNNAELIVEALTDSESLDKANVALVDKAEVLALYDISLIKDGVAVQPDGTAKVKIPTDNENAKVYRIEADGTATDMNAVYENGYLVFTTDHFSVYAVAEPVQAVLGDVTGDGKVKLIDAITIQKAALSMTELSGQALINADVNCDSKVNLLDAILAQKLALGMTA